MGPALQVWGHSQPDLACGLPPLTHRELGVAAPEQQASIFEGSRSKKMDFPSLGLMEAGEKSYSAVKAQGLYLLKMSCL
jgi:hypothetical protein